MILDLYEGYWQGSRSGRATARVRGRQASIRPRRRQTSLRAGRPMRVEHEYQRKGAWPARRLDVHTGTVPPPPPKTTGIKPFMA